jgi:SAM-dependent methyltransferase
VTEEQGASAVERGWRWDPTLYAGSAVHYAVGRVPYPPQVATALAGALRLDGSGVLLDVGCGPGSLTLLLAPYVAQAIGLDPDPDMVAHAARLARDRQLFNTVWRQMRAEDLPADLPRVDVVTFAQSLHWMDRSKVAAAVRALLLPGGALVHVHATTHQGLGAGADNDAGSGPDDALPFPRPPWETITDLVRHHLGPQPRAGQTVLPRTTGGGEDAVYRAAGFTGPQRLSVPGRTITRTTEQVFAAVHSLSSAAPHLFGDHLDAFDADLRHLLITTSDNGRFSEQMGDVGLDVWH